MRHACGVLLVGLLLGIVPSALAQSDWVLAEPPWDQQLIDSGDAIFEAMQLPKDQWAPLLERFPTADLERVVPIIRRMVGLSREEGLRIFFEAALQLEAPLGRWRQFRVFDTAEECESARSEVLKLLERLGADRVDVVVGARAARCLPATSLHR